MILFQAAFLVAVLLFLTSALRSSGSHAINAWKKIGWVNGAFVIVISVIFPDLTTAVAHLFGIGRGADMVGYLTTAAFLAYLLFQYLKSQRERDKVIRLARQVALIDAANRYHLN